MLGKQNNIDHSLFKLIYIITQQFKICHKKPRLNHGGGHKQSSKNRPPNGQRGLNARVARCEHFAGALPREGGERLLMRDLDETVRMIADRPLAEIIALLDREATVAEYAARRARHRNGPLGEKRASAMRQRDQIDRILFFLRHRSPALGATKEDDDLCNLLTKRLQARGEW